VKEKYEIHHGVRITDEAIVTAAVYSNRYITDRFLPDKVFLSTSFLGVICFECVLLLLIF
jgi:hypothetical protein